MQGHNGDSGRHRCTKDVDGGKGGSMDGPGGGGDERAIPLEIDDHFRLFGKEPWEVEYGEKCPECKSRIDEYGFCSCGSHGD